MKTGFTLLGSLIAIFIIAILALATLGILSNQNILISLIKGKFEKESAAFNEVVNWFLTDESGDEIVSYDLDDVDIRLVKKEVERSLVQALPNTVIKFEVEE